MDALRDGRHGAVQALQDRRLKLAASGYRSRRRFYHFVTGGQAVKDGDV